MSVVVNGYVPAVAAALGLTMGADLPIVESMLDNVTVVAIGAAEVGTRGKCVAIASVKDENDNTVNRVVCDQNGNAKMFSDGAAVVAMAKRSNLGAGQSVRIVKAARAQSVGDPIAALKNQHKSASREAASAAKPHADLLNKITAAQAQGWNTDPAGSPTRIEYDDLIDRRDSVAEWKTLTTARVATLAAALTAAGVDPVTYLPIQGGGG